jgi:two-component system, chemotaxis family, CheB/CheR fusion protein
LFLQATLSFFLAEKSNRRPIMAASLRVATFYNLTGNLLVIVQEPNEAEFDGMPQSAIATGLVDLILPVAEMPAAILRYDRTQPRLYLANDGEEVSPDETVLLHRVFAQLRARTDRDFSRYKRSTVLRRIARRMQLNYIEDLSAYMERLRERPEEVRALADDLLITVTGFFRDREVFERLGTVEIPRILAGKGAQDSVRVWSVGCATGEEVYSLAMLLLEGAEKHELPSHIQVFGSDLHSRSLERAREGFYPGDIEADVSAERLKRFFQQENGGFRIRKEVRDLVVFAPHNLLGDPPFSRLDLLSCRNLLIYLERDVQREVIELFHYALNPEGTLLLGSAESLEAADLFRVEDKKLCVFRRRSVPTREPRLPVFPLTRNRLVAGSSTVNGAPDEKIAYGSLHQQMVEEYAPPSVLIGPDDKIVHYSENAGRYLVHPGGAPTESVSKLVREELRVELQASLQAARNKKTAFDCKPIPVQFNGHARPIVMHVRPGLNPGREGFVLLIFEEREPVSESEKAPSSEWESQRNRELQEELNLSRQRLQATIEQNEASREEMKASSEEMQSTNEELRSTMEELETSKEELQSINEELQTVNQQNRHKVEELAQLTSDLQNLLAATEIATLFLDRHLRILRFTPKLGDLFNVRITDRGRPISDLTNRLGYTGLRADAEAVLSRLAPVEREVQDDAGRWYLTRVLPYLSSDDRIEGVAITFIDIDSRKRAEASLRNSEERLRKMVNIDVVGVLMFDNSGTLIDCNDTFLKMSGYTRAEVVAGNLTRSDIIAPGFLEITEKQMQGVDENGRIGPYETEYMRKDGTSSWTVFVGASLGDGTTIEYCFDISDRKQAQALAIAADQNLKLTNEALLEANTDLKHFSYAVSHDMREPLRMVISYTQLLARDYGGKLGADADQYIGFAVEGAKRMESLLNQLREYWAVDERNVHDLAPVDVNTILDTALGRLQTAIAASGAVILRDDLPTVLAEPYPLSVLFQNLIANAIKYRRSETPPEIRVSAQRNGTQWVFSVEDNGIGIEEPDLKVIFAPFKRLHVVKQPGNGLGLALCEKIVSRYRGQLSVQSKPGVGSTFRFTLPVLDAPHEVG